MNLVENTGDIVAEPHWALLLSDELELSAASEHWRRITAELRERSLLSPANTHAIQRLVIAYILHDRSARNVLEHGEVTKPKRGNSRAIARLSPHFTARRESASDAASLEAELGLSPRRRSSAAKVERKARTARAADNYLKPVAK